MNSYPPLLFMAISAVMWGGGVWGWLSYAVVFWSHKRHVMNNLPIVLCGMYIRPLTHWGLVTHICVSNIIIIGSDNGLAPSRRQAIIWTNAAILLTGLLGTNFSEILIKVCIFSFKKMHLKMSSGKWRPFCLGLNVLMMVYLNYHWVYFTTFHRFMCV